MSIEVHFGSNTLATTVRVADELMQQSPEVAFEAMGQPQHEILAIQFPKYIKETAQQMENLEIPTGLLTQDMMVTADILLKTIEFSGQDIPFEQAVRIANHDNTLRIMTSIALLRAEEAKEIASLARRSSSLFRLNTDNESIIVRPGMRIPEPPARGGCPVAQPVRDGLAPPLFRNFVKWSGTIAAHSGYHATWKPQASKTS